MTRRISAAPLLCALVLLLVLPRAAAGQETTEDEATLPAELRTARASLNEAMGRMDAAATTAHFIETGLVEFDGQVYSGRAAVGAWFTEAFAALASLTGGTSTFIVGDGEVTERASYSAVTSDGSPQGGRSETVWKRQEDGSWKIARLIVL